MPYDAYTNSPVHRFFQMWQQTDCNVDYATKDNPSGCLNDLFPWVETTVGAGSNGAPQPSNFNDTTTGEGSTAMGFYNMAQGDAPYFKELADKYTINDNFHQSVMGGTGANHIMFGFGDASATPTPRAYAAHPPINQIENPNPQLPPTTSTIRMDTAAAATSTAATSASPAFLPSPTTSSRSSGRSTRTASRVTTIWSITTIPATTATALLPRSLALHHSSHQPEEHR